VPRPLFCLSFTAKPKARAGPQCKIAAAERIRVAEPIRVAERIRGRPRPAVAYGLGGKRRRR
jgi:hypothetical protein